MDVALVKTTSFASLKNGHVFEQLQKHVARNPVCSYKKSENVSWLNIQLSEIINKIPLQGAFHSKLTDMKIYTNHQELSVENYQNFFQNPIRTNKNEGEIAFNQAKYI